MAGRIDLRKLPPLKALRGFEAATRHQSIRDAAEELCLTHPAISHQVQLIEEALGVPLFEPQGRHVVSTEEGRVLYPYVRSAFEALLDGVEAAQRHALDKPLRVHTYVTASIRWLAQRMPRFMAAHPEIKLALSTCAPEWEFDERHADVGLVYCETPPDPARFHWQPLFDYALYPVCAPDLAGRDVTIESLMALPLITITSEAHNWSEWFAAAGHPFTPAAPAIAVDTCVLAIEMALAGRGVALLNGPFAEAELADGRLVIPAVHRWVCEGSWGLICRKDRKDEVRLKTFADWLAANAGR